MEGLISIDGRFYKPDEAVVPALDRGFLLADNIFEVLVGFRDKILDVDRHLERLRASAEHVDLPLPWRDAELCFELQSLAERLACPKIYLRLVITRGVGLGLEPPTESKPFKIIYAFPARPQAAQLYQEGAKLRLGRLPYTERGPAAKTGSYLRSIVALKKAKTEGFDDVVFCNSEGEMTEATTANIFFIGRTGDLVEIATPASHSGILQGITRDSIIKLLAQASIPVRERIVYADELARFDEAFLCSTVKGLIPLAGIDDKRFYTLRPQSTFRHINRLYNSWVASQLGFFVDWNTGSRR